MKRLKTIHAVTVALLAGTITFAVAGCGETQTDDGYGTLTVADCTVSITSNYDFTTAVIQPVFSNPDKAEQLTYNLSKSASDYIKIEDGVVIPYTRAEKQFDVTAQSEHFSATFKVNVNYINFSTNTIYDYSRFSGSVGTMSVRCRDEVTADTTLLIGDSFMDDYFIKDYMSTFAKGKDIINAGISSTTSTQWEAFYKTVVGTTAPANIAIHIGTNNFYDENMTVAETAESIKRLLTYMHNSYPATNIYWFNISQRENINYEEQVDECNAIVAQWCAEQDKITCLDTCSKLTVGMLRDGVHPSTANYKIFTDALVEAGCVIKNK